MKKICAITTIDFTLRSFVVDAMRVLQGEGYDVTLIASMGDAFFERYSEEFHCVNLPMSRGSNPVNMLKSIVALYRIFRRERFDYIQYATPNAAFYASVASRLARCPVRVYCQWGIRYVGFSGLRRWFFKMIEVATCRLSTHIRPASRKNLEFAVSEGHYPASKAAIIGDGGTIGVDFSVFDKSLKAANKAEVLARHPQLEGKFVYGFVGRMDKDKGINELFTAFLGLSGRYPDVALLVVGPEDKLGGIDSALYQRVRECGAAVFTGYSSEAAKYISALDVLVHPSYREGFSMVIQQAMAMELAVVTTDIPGPSEVVEAGVSGLLVPARDACGLQKVMETVHNDGALRASVARAGYERAHRLFGRQRMLELTLIDRKNIMNDN